MLYYQQFLLKNHLYDMEANKSLVNVYEYRIVRMFLSFFTLGRYFAKGSSIKDVQAKEMDGINEERTSVEIGSVRW